MTKTAQQIEAEQETIEFHRRTMVNAGSVAIGETIEITRYLPREYRHETAQKVVTGLGKVWRHADPEWDGSDGRRYAPTVPVQYAYLADPADAPAAKKEEAADNTYCSEKIVLW